MALAMLRFLTAGESHGQALVVIVEGVPAGLPLRPPTSTPDLARRQLGYGRGRRMAIEQDRAEILSGVRRGETLGSPIALLIRNRDWANWQHTMSVEAEPGREPCRARGARRSRGRGPATPISSAGSSTAATDLRDMLERASARETAARVAAGAVARALLRRFGIDVASHVIEIGGAALPDPLARHLRTRPRARRGRRRAMRGRRTVAAAMRRGGRRREARPATRSAARSRSSRTACRRASAATSSGIASSTAGSAQALMSIPAIKAVGIGRGDRGRRSARLAGPRRDRACRRQRRPARSPGSRGRPTAPAGSKAA